jgi:hypothetical protein
MSLRTNPDRILENIDRARERKDEGPRSTERQAIGKELEIDLPDIDATNPERMRRIFKVVERGYAKAAANRELGKLAARFQSVGDIPKHHAHGDVSVSVQYIDSPRPDDIGVAPFEIIADDLLEAKKDTKTSRPDVNALKVLRVQLRDGVRNAYKKIEPRLRDALRDRADMGHIAVQVTMDVRAVGGLLSGDLVGDLKADPSTD